MLFDSIKEMDRLRKEMNCLLSKRMSNIYSSYYTGKLTPSKLRLSNFKTFVTRSVFVELQLMQISLSFKTSRCHVKIRDLRAKLYVTFLLF